jgi:quinol monooxygenase YgiN
MNVYVFAKWQVKEGQIDAVLSLLTDVVRESTQEPGNLFYKIHQDKQEANTLVLYEGYVDEAAVDAHRQSAHFQDVVIGKIVPLLANREVVVANLLEL